MPEGQKAVQCELWKGVVQLLYFLGYLFKLTNVLWVKITSFGNNGIIGITRY